ncbi:DUF4105 domain-containing protein [Euryarchaeota archaeon]|nr:DUF4105 domain-containing protein [Euryarchaeota archaeon]|tara:strand:- start:730 stop:1575 length:846 start_codon:yes stop_codon:yes gene_type:complete
MSTLTLLGLSLLILSIIGIYSVWRRIRHLTPSNDLSWVNENKYIAYAEIDNDEVILKNVRDFNWRTTKDFDEKWIEKKFKISDCTKIWLVLEYFYPTRRPIAHTLLSFEFKDGTRISCSIEVRREPGEKFSPIKGLLREFEIMYVWATEKDAIGVRSRCRKSETHLFEAIILGEGNQCRMLESYLRRTNQLYENPEFYNSLFNNCTTNIASHVNDVYPGRVPRAIGVILPGLSPKLLKRNNLVKLRGGSIKEEMKLNQVEERARAWDQESDFGDAIRIVDS